MTVTTAASPSISRISFSDTPREGAGEFTISVTLSTGSPTTDNTLEGSTFYWKISGLQIEDILPDYLLNGSGILNKGKLDFRTSLAKDNVQENEPFTVSVYADSLYNKQIGQEATSVILGDIGAASTSATRTTKLDANTSQLILTGDYSINGTGNALNNFIQGNNGSNLLNGGLGNDVLAGGAGNDTYIVDSAFDTVTEGVNAGIDTVSASVNWVLGENIENLSLTGKNTINGTGNNLNNTISGNNMNNILDGGAGNDMLTGGGGDDFYIVDSTGDVISERFYQGIDTVQSSINWTLSINLENLILTGSDAINGKGNASNNILTGNAADNVLDGGGGNDIMTGGLGNDTYVVDSTGDTIKEDAGAGIDTVRSSASWSLADNLENLTLSGKSAIGGTGNSLNNTIIGNVANNILNGGLGDDTLDGGGGTDTLLGGNGNDIYIVDTVTDIIKEISGGGSDTIRSSVSYTLGENVESLVLTGGAIDGTGNSLNNTITGNTLNNTLNGGLGDDILDGGGGLDTFTGLGGADTFYFSTKGTLSVGSASHITDFNRSEGDLIKISRSAFGIPSGATVSIATITSSTQLDGALGTANTFVYDSISGNLYWNQNGDSAGAGSGGVLAVVDNHADLNNNSISLA